MIFFLSHFFNGFRDRFGVRLDLWDGNRRDSEFRFFNGFRRGFQFHLDLRNRNRRDKLLRGNIVRRRSHPFDSSDDFFFSHFFNGFRDRFRFLLDLRNGSRRDDEFRFFNGFRGRFGFRLDLRDGSRRDKLLRGNIVRRRCHPFDSSDDFFLSHDENNLRLAARRMSVYPYPTRRTTLTKIEIKLNCSSLRGSFSPPRNRPTGRRDWDGPADIDSRVNKNGLLRVQKAVFYG